MAGLIKKVEYAAGFYFAQKRRNKTRENTFVVQVFCRHSNPDGRGLRFYLAASDRFFINGEVCRLEQGGERIAFLRVFGSANDFATSCRRRVCLQTEIE